MSFNPEQSLQVIENMILKTKTNFKETNKYFILWGVIISLTCVVEYLMIRYSDSPYYYMPWLVLPVVGWILTISLSMRQERHQSTILGDAIKWVWVGFGIGFMMVFAVAWMRGFNPSPLMMLLSGIGTFITSRILRSTPYLLGSLVLFGSSIACMYVSGPGSLLIVAAAMMLGYILPAVTEKNA